MITIWLIFVQVAKSIVAQMHSMEFVGAETRKPKPFVVMDKELS